jgi:hypothetical protein
MLFTEREVIEGAIALSGKSAIPADMDMRLAIAALSAGYVVLVGGERRQYALTREFSSAVRNMKRTNIVVHNRWMPLPEAPR